MSVYTGVIKNIEYGVCAGFMVQDKDHLGASVQTVMNLEAL